MRNHYTKGEIRDYASEAFDAVDRAVDITIWRTNQRIRELVREENKENPNPFYTHPLWFTDILVRRLFYGGLTAAHGAILTSESEKFEESCDEPILLDDLHMIGDDTYASIFTERMMYSLLITGMNYDEAKIEFLRVFDTRLLQLEKNARESGVFKGSLFYRRVDIPRSKKVDTPLPAVPVGMS